MTARKTFRLVTRCDFDGLASAVLLSHLGLVGEVVFAAPEDMLGGKVTVSDQDVTTNLPYVDGVRLAFDHHPGETLKVGPYANHILDADAASAARVVFNYYGGTGTFPESFDAMLAAVDQGDCARFSRNEILHPTGWPLLAFILDPKTGLGGERGFRVGHEAMVRDLIGYCRDHGIDDILHLADVKERVDLYLDHEDPFKDQLRRLARVEGASVLLDWRAEPRDWVGNRFMVYALFPECSVSVQMMRSASGSGTVFQIGRSILNRGGPADIGALARALGGDGHANAGFVIAGDGEADRVLATLQDRLGRAG